MHPGPSQPNFPAAPIQAPCPHRLSYKTPPTLRPTQSPLQSLKPALPPSALHPRPVNSGLCPEHCTGRQPRPLNRWTRGTGTARERGKRRLISTEWCQIDLFFLSGSMNIPYISIKINYPLCLYWEIHLDQGNHPDLGATSFCLFSEAKLIFLYFSLLPIKHRTAPCKNQHTFTHNHHHNSLSILSLYSPRYQQDNYHTRKRVPSPIIIPLLDYPQNQRGCFPPVITDATFLYGRHIHSHLNQYSIGLHFRQISWLLLEHYSNSPT